MSVNLQDLFKLSNQKWVTVDKYKFLYEEAGADSTIKVQMRILKIENQEERAIAENDLAVELLFKGIRDWENVKVRDLFKSDTNFERKEFKEIDLDADVVFNQNNFKQFLSVNNNIMKFYQILNKVREDLEEENEETDNTKKK